MPKHSPISCTTCPTQTRSLLRRRLRDPAQGPRHLSSRFRRVKPLSAACKTMDSVGTTNSKCTQSTHLLFELQSIKAPTANIWLSCEAPRLHRISGLSARGGGSVEGCSAEYPCRS